MWRRQVWSGATEPCPPIHTEDAARLPADEGSSAIRDATFSLAYGARFIFIVGNDCLVIRAIVAPERYGPELCPQMDHSLANGVL